MILLKLSAFSLIYICSFRPLSTPKENLIEIFNESTILIACYVVMILLEVGSPIESRNFFGWMIILFAAFNILVNMSMLLFNTVVGAFKEIQQKIINRKSKRKFKSILEKRRLIANEFPDQFVGF